MAIAHDDRLTVDGELNRAAKAAAFVSFSVAHDVQRFHVSFIAW
jgi:hypothetical protein